MGPYLAQPITEKTIHADESKKNKIKYTVGHMQGWRRTMEDAFITEKDLGDGNSLFAVFDGHGGHEVAVYVEKKFTNLLRTSKLYKEGKFSQALIDTFKKIDELIESKEGEDQLRTIANRFDPSSNSLEVLSMTRGCTANVILITPLKIYTANAGDSRSVLCSKGIAFPLSSDHKPENEQQHKRILEAGGSIINGRVQGGLNLSRSLGDFNYKQNKDKSYSEQAITCMPDVTERTRSMNEDEFILAGCDGIWERYIHDSQPLITRVWNQRKTNHETKTIVAGLLDSLLAKDTAEGIGCDNMTIILIEFI